MYTFNTAHYREVVKTLPLALIEKVGQDQIVYHVSTVFFAPSALLGLDVEIEVGLPSPLLQAAMRALDIKQLIGMTPQYPISNPQATQEENRVYVETCQATLTSRGVRYIPSQGRALDFQAGGGGCFIVVDGLDQIGDILADQLSYTCLEQEGVGMLIG